MARNEWLCGVDLLETITAQYPDLEPEPEVSGGDIIAGEREQ